MPEVKITKSFYQYSSPPFKSFGLNHELQAKNHLIFETGDGTPCNSFIQYLPFVSNSNWEASRIFEAENPKFLTGTLLPK